MDVATTFLPLLQVFAYEMNQPTFQSFTTLVAGWLLAPRRTIIGMVRASATDRHHASFHRIFASANWSVERVGLAVFDLITQNLGTVFLIVDDTLLPRFGMKVFGTGMHRDPMLSSHGFTVTRWGLCWVVLCVNFESRHTPGRFFALPVLFRLYFNKKAARKWSRAYRKKTDLMIDMLEVLQNHIARGEKRLHLVGDSAFTAPAVLAKIPKAIAVTGRVVSNVRIHQAPPKPTPGKLGRPRTRGERLPTPKEMLEEKGLRRLEIKLYEGSAYRIRVAEQTGRFFKAPEREMKIIATEHLRGGRGVEVFYTTEVDDSIETVLTHYSWRWPIEVTFHDAKQHLGLEEPENRTTHSVRRTTPTGFLLYSLIVWWHETVREEPVSLLRVWKGKSHPSFADMLASLRKETLETTHQTHFSTPATSPGVQKFINHITHLLALAS